MLDTSQHMLLTKIGKSEETFIVFLNKKKKKTWLLNVLFRNDNLFIFCILICWL